MVKSLRKLAVSPARTLELLEHVGAERCIVASDVGMLLEPAALEALRLMIRFHLEELRKHEEAIREFDPPGGPANQSRWSTEPEMPSITTRWC